jgi:glycine cleavage system H protein
MYPTDFRYTKDHEWISIAGARGRVGITDYAQRQLGDVVYVELPEVGKIFARGQAFGTIESVKAVSELYCPMSGEVVEVNANLLTKPELINTAPHDAWLVVLALSEPGEAESLLDSVQYGALVT